MLVRIHTRATTSVDPTCLAFGRSFDAPLLMWEFDHFVEYGVIARRGPLETKHQQIIRAEFHKIAERLAALPKVFTHRDYHSRNLMIDGANLGVIDFQDALMGPAVYDLASLLRDAYIALDEPVVDALIGHYLDAMVVENHRFADRSDFRRMFDLMSIQRNLKAAGRFVYIDRVKHRFEISCRHSSSVELRKTQSLPLSRIVRPPRRADSLCPRTPIFTALAQRRP